MKEIPNTYSQQWFGLFLETIPDEQTEREVAFIVRHVSPDTHTILDLCCGTGRHARLLAASGFDVTGVDINTDSNQSSSHLQLITMDVRQIATLGSSYDAMICMWASFGHFSESENNVLLKDCRSMINTGGYLILDIYNRNFFERHQGEQTFEKEGKRIREVKSITGNRLLVDLEYNGENHDSFSWQIFSPEEIIAFAGECGWYPATVCTMFDERLLPSEEIPRMQVVLNAV